MTLKENWTTFKANLKNVWKSKTIWANAIAATLISVLPEIAQELLPQLKPFLDASLYQKLGTAIVIMNFALRFVTTTSLAQK